MILKKLFTLLASVLILFGFSSNAFAELFSISAGIPVQHTFNAEWDSALGGDAVESDGVSGYMFHVKFPIMFGVGLETYTTKIKDPDLIENVELSTTLYDVFWLTPIPIINFTIGAGAGTAKLECDVIGGGKCSDKWEDGGFGSTTQLWAQLGFPIFPFIDIHASYHVVSTSLKGKDSNSDSTLNGNVIGIGAAFIF